MTNRILTAGTTHLNPIDTMGIFIKTPKGYKEAKAPEYDFVDGSINDIVSGLGYHPDQAYTYHGTDFRDDFQIKQVVVKIFTDQILFVMADTTRFPLNKHKIDYFMRNFSVREIFDSYETEVIFNKGIANKSLTASYLSSVLKTNIGDEGVTLVDSLGLFLYMNAGLLTNFSSADGLGVWAKKFRELNPTLFRDYVARAEQVWGSQKEKITREVNQQADALFGTPQATKNEFVPLHTDPEGLIDFVMLQVCHYDRVMELPEFLEINHGRYQVVPTDDNPAIVLFKVGRFIYEFSGDHLRSVRLA